MRSSETNTNCMMRWVSDRIKKSTTFVKIMGRLKTRDWKTRDQFTWVKNSRRVAMERRSYKCSKTEMLLSIDEHVHAVVICTPL